MPIYHFRNQIITLYKYYGHIILNVKLENKNVFFSNYKRNLQLIIYYVIYFNILITLFFFNRNT